MDGNERAASDAPVVGNNPIRVEKARIQRCSGILRRMVRWLMLILRLAVAREISPNLLLEYLALRHQLLVLSRTVKRPRLTPLDRALLGLAFPRLERMEDCPFGFQPDTVIHWHRAGFRLFWRWKRRPRPTGRKAIPRHHHLIRK